MAERLSQTVSLQDLLASRHSLRLWGPALHWEFRLSSVSTHLNAGSDDSPLSLLLQPGFHHSSGLCRIWPLHNLRQFRLAAGSLKVPYMACSTVLESMFLACNFKSATLGSTLTVDNGG